jgi:peptide/nickel transport system permease protein
LAQSSDLSESEYLSELTDQIYIASQWQLMWWRFKKHHLAVAGGIVLLAFYFVSAITPFLATYDPHDIDAELSLLSPRKIHWFDGWKPSPHVYGLSGVRDQITYKRVYTEDPSIKIPVHFFVTGYDYKLFGLIPMNRHLIGAEPGVDGRRSLFILGTDLQGRDLYSRILYGTRISMSIGLIGVTLALFFGIGLGGISGFYGGLTDSVIQRTIEVVRSIPTIPLWMGLAAALPRDWTVIQVYFAITLILSIFSWTELARVVRGRFLSLREEDFVMAAELSGAPRLRIIFRHMVPSFYSHIIAASTLAVPEMIISETALSFLGLGLRPPAISFGTLLQAAQNVQTIAIYPWILLPAVFVVVAVLAFNFLGDGLRDAADPYG